MVSLAASAANPLWQSREKTFFLSSPELSPCQKNWLSATLNFFRSSLKKLFFRLFQKDFVSTVKDVQEDLRFRVNPADFLVKAKAVGEGDGTVKLTVVNVNLLCPGNGGSVEEGGTFTVFFQPRLARRSPAAGFNVRRIVRIFAVPGSKVRNSAEGSDRSPQFRPVPGQQKCHVASAAAPEEKNFPPVY